MLKRVLAEWGLWLRGAIIAIAILGTAFSLYARLVRIEERLAAVEGKMETLLKRGQVVGYTTVVRHEDGERGLR
jgi:hypothetical protein